MDQTCPKCGSNAIIEEPQLGSTFCSLCGHVLNESEIQGELELQNIRGIIDYGENKRGHAFESIYEPRQAVALLPSINPSSFVSLYNNSQELVKSKALALVDDLLVRLHLPRTYENQVKHLALELFTKRGKWTCGILGQMLIASCVYIVCRQNNKPITLLDVADAIGCNVFKLGEYYRDVLNTLQITINEIDPALFIERALNKLMEYAHEDNNPIDRTAIVNQAIRLVNIAKREWLTVGRKPTAIAAASLLIALQTSSLQKYASIETLASTLQTSVRTIRDRQKELNEILIAIGKQLPWGEQITINNLHLHLSSILKYLEFVHSKTESERQRHENAETNKRPHATVTSSPIESEGSRKRQKNDWKQQPEKHSNLIPAPSSSSSSLSTTTTTTTTSSSSSTTTTPSLLETSSTSSTVSPLKTVATTTVNCFEQLLDSVSLLPPSFRHGQANRMRRVEKIEKAKKRICQHSITSSLDVVDKNEIGILSTPPNESFSSPRREALDDEDRLIERLLREGVDENLIVDGYYNAVPRTKEIHARDNSNCPDDTELCECDLSDRELKHYLRTEEEIKALSSLSATSQENKET